MDKETGVPLNGTPVTETGKRRAPKVVADYLAGNREGYERFADIAIVSTVRSETQG